MRHGTAGITASIALGLAVVGSRAHASDADTERARALFDEAGELERHGQWAAAGERLRAALRLRETPQLYYALGWAFENDDKLLEAKAEYENAARLGRERPAGDEAVRLATTRLAGLERKMPVIRVRVSGGARSSTRVIVDGREIKRDDDVATTTADPGSHVVRIERGSDGSVEQLVYVGRSTVRAIEVDAGDLVAVRDTTQDRHGEVLARSATPPPPSLRADVTGERKSVVPWLLLSGGIASIAGGTALLVSSAMDSDLRATQTDATDTKRAIAFSLGIVGLVSTTVGAILLFRRDNAHAEKRTRTKASVAAVPGGAFASASLSF